MQHSTSIIDKISGSHAGSVLVLLIGLIGCSERPAEHSATAEASSDAATTATLPPGFTDAPPPPPTSNTLVLSGGFLETEPAISDSVVVITDGVIQGWGRRGMVELPNDSIGVDMRGKWIRAAEGLTSGDEASLLIYDQSPADQARAPVGSITGNAVDLPEPD